MTVNAYETQNALCEGHQIKLVATLFYQFFCSFLLSFSFLCYLQGPVFSQLLLVREFWPQVVQSNQNPL